MDQDLVSSGFAVMVTGRPGSVSADVALQFVQAALNSGNSVDTVFFYHDGVEVLADAGAADRWTQLTDSRPMAGPHGPSLLVCAAATERREELCGLVIPAGFQIASLAPWLDAALRVDRVVRFGPIASQSV